MRKGFYTIIATQFFSSLADNALLIAAIALLQKTLPSDTSWMEPLLKWTFTLSYVLFAAFVGAFADALPKGRVMLISNSVKILGCVCLIFGMYPLAAYAVVGLGAATYSPAKYGILTELLPPQQLVQANSWIEGTTIASIILGAILGGALLNMPITINLAAALPTLFDSVAHAAMLFIMLSYVVAALFNLLIPNTGVDHRIPSKNPIFLAREFAHCCALLWKDKLGQISLATTTVFWGAGATLQFIVLQWADKLNWSVVSDRLLQYDRGLANWFASSIATDPLFKGTLLQGVFAIGIAIGAVLAARAVSLKKSVSILPLGMLMGLSSIAMIWVHDIVSAFLLLISVGMMAGFFIVPMNALLQHRGHVLMGAGHSIAVQNFNENIGILVLLSLYAVLLKLGLSINHVITLFGLFVFASILLVTLRHRHNQSQNDSLHLIGMDKPVIRNQGDAQK
ncbi:MAG: lysophospholipid transporter LplT [Burkholderiales bacterium]|jgi:MFS family permease|nr:lysophospholipid transporter LplT [Burkholderiales bacterium]